jgi:hypothetical protein
VPASHWNDFGVKNAPKLTRPDYTVAEIAKSPLIVRRLFSFVICIKVPPVYGTICYRRKDVLVNER